MKRTYAYVEVLVYIVRQVCVSSVSLRANTFTVTLVLLAGKVSSLSDVGTTCTLVGVYCWASACMSVVRISTWESSSYVDLALVRAICRSVGTSTIVV
jgi:hypothetical protein